MRVQEFKWSDKYLSWWNIAGFVDTPRIMCNDLMSQEMFFLDFKFSVNFGIFPYIMHYVWIEILSFFITVIHWQELGHDMNGSLEVLQF